MTLSVILASSLGLGLASEFARAQTLIPTAGVIAMENLDHDLRQSDSPERRVALLLERARYLGDYEALHAARAWLPKAQGNEHAVLAVRVQLAAHEFRDARRLLDGMAARVATEARFWLLRAALEVATGGAQRVLSELEHRAASTHDVATYCTLATAYAALERWEEADAAYEEARSRLRTTHPFPYAWIAFSRGRLWAEPGAGGDPERGEHFYDEAIALLPSFVPAGIHKAELEVARGDYARAATRLQSLLHISREPEALALLAVALRGKGEASASEEARAAAQARFHELLRKERSAVTSHAIEFFKDAGRDSALARQLETEWTARSGMQPEIGAH
ncbi:hypothetical protein C7S18_19775 [Ahniella affigens]|uniref:Tetratricopeptide repeat protein n=1 Tax=Ahniella affigens TaxID=2021234 RepID=A0A2P1PWR4_9GAMM|nr:hypothetical protein [Ahniella affigens]AVP99266.1 hypothetical protein C7S18_19775 [Ahniella affigens]